MLNIQTKYLTLFFILSFITPTLMLFETFTPEGDIYILANDIISNFQFDEFNGDPMTMGGGNDANTLKAEVGTSWKLYKKDIELINSYVLGDKKCFQYKITLRNELNFHSNYDLTQVTDKIESISSNYLVNELEYRDGGVISPAKCWERYVKFYYYNFYDSGETMYSHHGDDCMLTGAVKMSFDIVERTLPKIEDAEGNIYDNKFAYIGVSSAHVYNSSIGLLSEENPVINSIIPELHTLTEGTIKKDSKGDTHDCSIDWDTDIKLGKPFIAGQAGVVQGQTDMSSLNPSTRDGGSNYEVTQMLTSQPDCALYYNIGKLSPQVKEWKQKLSYNKRFVRINVDLGGCKIKVDDSSSKSHTKPVAVSVNNQYIHTNFAIVFNIFAEYEIKTTDTNEGDAVMGTPTEDSSYIWTTTVDGYGGGQTFIDGTNLFDIFGGILGIFGNILTCIIYIAIAAVAIIIINKLFLLKKTKKAKKSVRIHLKK